MEFIQQNIMLVLLAVTSGAMLAFTSFGGRGRVSVNEATQLINRDDAQVIDLRDAADFAGGHLVGAHNIPAAKLGESAAELEKLKGKPLIVCCATGARSGKAAATLRKQGFGPVHDLEGGIDAWRTAGLPLTRKGGRK